LTLGTSTNGTDVTEPSAFVPKTWLEVPGYFGKQEDVQWHLAGDLDGAMELYRVREQHELALAMTPDAAGVRQLHRRRRPGPWTPDASTLGRKLSGTFPATEWDLILWRG
jgi:hypothetical protein